MNKILKKFVYAGLILVAGFVTAKPSNFSVPPDPFQEYATAQEAVPAPLNEPVTTPLPPRQSPPQAHGHIEKPLLLTLAEVYDFFHRQNNINSGLQLTTRKAIYRIGETISFSVRSQKGCYLTLIDISSDKQQVILLPNQMQQDNFIQPREKIIIPTKSAGFDLVVEGPAGTENVLAICKMTAEPVYQGNYAFDRYIFKELQQHGEHLSHDLDITLTAKKGESYALLRFSIQ